MDGLHIAEENRAGWQVVTLEGRIDSVTSDGLEAALCAAVAAHPQVAVNCAAVDYISSMGLRALLKAGRAAQAAKREFLICSPSKRVKDVFEISRMHQVLAVREALPC